MDTSDQASVGADESDVPPRRMRTNEEKRRIVEEALVPGASVAAVARRHGVNANLLFGWRRLHKQGLLERSREPAVPLLPSTDATRGLLDAAAFAALPAGAHVVNLGRGDLIVEADLVAALDRGHLGHATLDVFRDEPLPATSPFYDLDNVIVTPHTAWSSGRVLDRSVELFCDNLRRFSTGEPLLNVVDPAAGY